jgi:exonuclease III
VAAVELRTDDVNIIMFSVYMPFFDSSNRDHCIQETVETISMIDLICDDHPCHRVIIGGDFNSEFSNDSAFDEYWRELMDKRGLDLCDDFISNENPYTYHHASLNHKKWLDHFIVSQDLKLRISGCSIIDVGDNTSDHLPIMMTMNMSSGRA